MRAAGALRIDHVLGLMRLFWVPAGGSAADGAYVHYPVQDLLAVTALESRRARCVVVGEDLGTVPDAIRAALADNGVLSYRVLYFEKHWQGDHSFRQPEHYPEQALVTVSTHDLATLAGFWLGHDLDLRDALHLFPGPEAAAGQRATREHDRWRLLEALDRQGLRPAQVGEPGAQPPGDDLVCAVHRFLARSPAAILSVQMEDVLGELEQANLPGTVDERPNWRRKLSLALEDWADHAPLRALAQAVRAERG
jgi:4-alpha-glucanotransferase